MLIINFSHVPAGVPLFMVCGLPLSIRAALEGIRSGFKYISLLVQPEDLVTVVNLFKCDSRLEGIHVAVSTDELLNNFNLQTNKNMGTTVTVVPGDRVWRANLLADLHEESCHGGAKIYSDRNTGFGMAKIMTTDLAKYFASNEKRLFPLSEFSDSDTECQHVIESDWYAVPSDKNIRGAENFLLSRLIKKADGVVSRNINRKISLSITRRLMTTAVTPNQVTAVVMLVGILSGPVTAGAGGYIGLVLGALLYYAAAVLDGCDGELSRLRFQGTPYGAWLDTVVDDAVGLSYITGLYIYLSMQSAGWGWVGCIAIFFYVLTLAPRYYVMAFFMGSGDYQKLSSLKPRPATTGVLFQAVRMFEDTVCRTDFIPFAAVVTAVLHSSEIFAGLFMLGCIGSAIDSLATFFSMRERTKIPT